MITAKSFRERSGTLAEKITSDLFADGITIAAPESAVIGLSIGAVATGISMTGAVTTGITMSGTKTTGVAISGTSTNGIAISGTQTTGIAISGTNTTGISIAGTVTTGVTIGTSGTPITLATYASSAIKVYTTCASTDASNSVQPVLFNSTMTGTGGVGGRFRVNMDISDVALGGWANAFKASVDCGASGRATGLLSVACFEIDMPSAHAGGGTTAIIELEITSGSGWTAGAPVDVFYFNNTGDGKAGMDTQGYFFDIQGLTEGSGKLLRVAAPTTAAASLRCKVGATTYYLPLFSTQN